MNSYGQKSERLYENVKENVHFHLFLIFIRNFLLMAWNLKWIFGALETIWSPWKAL